MYGRRCERSWVMQNKVEFGTLQALSLSIMSTCMPEATANVAPSITGRQGRDSTRKRFSKLLMPLPPTTDCRPESVPLPGDEYNYVAALFKYWERSLL